MLSTDPYRIWVALTRDSYTRSAALFASHEERGAQDCCQVLTLCVSRAADTLSQVMTVRHFCNLNDTLLLVISRL